MSHVLPNAGFRIIDWLRPRSLAAAREFLEAVKVAYELIGEPPRIGSIRHAAYCPELPHALRFFPLAGFPRILIHYMDRPDVVEVIRVRDASHGLEGMVEDLEA